MVAEKFEYVINLAAQAGVRYSLKTLLHIQKVMLMGFYQS